MNRVYFYSPRGGWPTNVMVPSERVKEVADKLLGRTKDNPFRSISIDPEFMFTMDHFFIVGQIYRGPSTATGDKATGRQRSE